MPYGPISQPGHRRPAAGACEYTCTSRAAGHWRNAAQIYCEEIHVIYATCNLDEPFCPHYSLGGQTHSPREPALCPAPLSLRRVSCAQQPVRVHEHAVPCDMRDPLRRLISAMAHAPSSRCMSVNMRFSQAFSTPCGADLSQESCAQQAVHVREHALLGLQAVGEVQQDAKEAVGDRQQQDHAPQPGALARQLRQGQRKDGAKHHNDHDLQSTAHMSHSSSQG